MSGGGGSDFDFGGSGSGGGAPKPCDTLTFDDVLVSPDPAVVATLTVGQVLDVEPHAHTVAAFAPAGRAGSLLNQLTRLLECLQQGFLFKADVLSITGGHVRVHVRPE